MSDLNTSERLVLEQLLKEKAESKKTEEKEKREAIQNDHSKECKSWLKLITESLNEIEEELDPRKANSLGDWYQRTVALVKRSTSSGDTHGEIFYQLINNKEIKNLNVKSYKVDNLKIRDDEGEKINDRILKLGMLKESRLQLENLLHKLGIESRLNTAITNLPGGLSDKVIQEIKKLETDEEEQEKFDIKNAPKLHKLYVIIKSSEGKDTEKISNALKETVEVSKMKNLKRDLEEDEMVDLDGVHRVWIERIKRLKESNEVERPIMYNDLIYKDMMKLFKSDSEKKIKKVITKVMNRAALRREEVDTEAMFEESRKMDTGESIIRPIVTIEEPEIYYDGKTEGFNHPKLKEKEKPFTDKNGNTLTKKEAALKYPW